LITGLSGRIHEIVAAARLNLAGGVAVVAGSIVSVVTPFPWIQDFPQNVQFALRSFGCPASR